VLLGACATTPGTDRVAERDPYEKFNRSMYGINRGLDRYALKPAAQGYRFIIPASGRQGISNVYSNTSEPLSFVNAILQGKFNVAMRTFARFFINTTLGVGGLADHASGMGLSQQREDFGQTFAVWGLPSGPYLMLPLIGPTTIRDGAGSLVAAAGGDPIGVPWRVVDGGIAFTIGRAGGSVLDSRTRATEAGADAILDTSADEYATVRSAYLQSRRAEIYDGNPPDVDADFGDEPEPAVGAEPAVEPAVKPALEPKAPPQEVRP